MAKRTRYAAYKDRYANCTFELSEEGIRLMQLPHQRRQPRVGLGHRLARETYAQRQFFPMGGGMRGLDRPWDQEPWSD